MWRAVYILAIITIVFFGGRGFVNWFIVQLRLAKIPSAPGETILGHLQFLLNPRGPYLISDAASRLGPIFRWRFIHKNFVIITDSATVTSITAKGLSYLPKDADIYRGFNLVLSSHSHNMVSAPDDAQQRAVRKAILACFNVSNLRALLPSIVKRSQGIADQAVANGGHLDMVQAAKRLTMDVIGEFGYGEDFGMSDDLHKPRPFFDLVERAIVAVGDIFADPLFNFKRFTKRTQDGFKDCARWEQWLENFVTRVMSAPPPPNSLLAALLAVRSPETGEPLSKERLMAEIGVLLVAGFETTSHSMSMTLMQLLANPETLAKVQDELRQLGLAPDHGRPGRTLVWDDLSKLKYLNAAIKESLRLMGPAAMGSVRITKEDTVLCGHVVPKGVSVMLAPFAIDRIQRNYGADCLHFRPERWLEGPGTPKEPFMFSSGPRDCVGQSLARLELQAFLATLLSRHSVHANEQHHPNLRHLIDHEIENHLVLQPKAFHIVCSPLL